ncbi:WD40 repeat-like protein [Neoconidiobolus thromboides FSU 785]|nr:WD40 repeat-like protein [Neoconidiobolus thromboides FSU 785]
MTNAANSVNFDSQHEDMIHDVQLDYYGKRLASCSSDRTIRLFEVEQNEQKLIQVLTGHEGPVWQVSWAHPKFGNILASCSYDAKVFIWKQINNTWSIIKEHNVHTSSVNSIAWAPHELGPILACASSDGKVSTLSYKEDGTWESSIFDAHAIGCNAISWAPPTLAGSLTQSTVNKSAALMRFATAGCDNLVKIWTWKEDLLIWKEEEEVLDGHTDWVRDIAWAPSIGFNQNILASCSQDKTVLIWTQNGSNNKWNKTVLKSEPFPDVVWRLSWSQSGNILAVSCGNNTVSLWKQNLNGEWETFSELKE